MPAIRPLRFDLVIGAAALLARLVFVLAMPALGLAPLANPDAVQYEALARDLAAGRGWATDAIGPTEMFFRPPLYPWVVAGLYAIFGPHIGVVQAAQCLLGAGSALLAAALARRLGGATAAWIAGAIVAFHPLLIQQSGELLTEALFVFLYLAALLLFLRAADRPDRENARRPATSALAAGGVLGLSILCRPTPLALLPILAAALFLWRSRRIARSAGPPPLGAARASRYGPPLRATVLYLAGVGLVLAPWQLWMADRQGAGIAVATTSEFTLYLGNAPGWAERVFFRGEEAAGQDWDLAHYRMIRERPPGWFAAEARRNIAADPGRFVRLTAIRAGRLAKVLPDLHAAPGRILFSFVAHTILLPLGLVGLVAALRRREPFAWIMLLCFLAAVAGPAVSVPNVRYRVAMVDSVLPVFAALLLARHLTPLLARRVAGRAARPV